MQPQVGILWAAPYALVTPAGVAGIVLMSEAYYTHSCTQAMPGLEAWLGHDEVLCMQIRQVKASTQPLKGCLQCHTPASCWGRCLSD